MSGPDMNWEGLTALTTFVDLHNIDIFVYVLFSGHSKADE